MGCYVAIISHGKHYLFWNPEDDTRPETYGVDLHRELLYVLRAFGDSWKSMRDYFERFVQCISFSRHRPDEKDADAWQTYEELAKYTRQALGVKSMTDAPFSLRRLFLHRIGFTESHVVCNSIQHYVIDMDKEQFLFLPAP